MRIYCFLLCAFSTGFLQAKEPKKVVALSHFYDRDSLPKAKKKKASLLPEKLLKPNIKISVGPKKKEAFFIELKMQYPKLAVESGLAF